MSNEKMSADDVLKIMDTDGRAVALYADTCGTGLRYKQWAAHLKRHDEAREAVAALIAEHNEDQGVIAVWRGRCERAEAERDALIAERDALRELHTAVCRHGNWDDGCFYYARYAAPELETALRNIDAALANEST